MINWNNFIQEETNQNSVKIDQAFRKIWKNSICFHIWKVEQDRLETIPKSQYGIFYDDCMYIIYAAANSGGQVNQDTITREVKNSVNLERFIHFWLDEKATPKNSGYVVFKIMELDNYTGNVATQYRETQGNESTRFLSYFKKGLLILSSSIRDQNLNGNHQEPCRLFQITGKQWPICVEKETVNWEHFSSDYIMLLKTGKMLFVWLGRSTSSLQKRNAIELADKLKNDFKLNELIITDDGYEQSMNKSVKDEWNLHLPLKNRFVNQKNPLIKDNVMTPSSSSRILKFYKCGYNLEKYRIEELKSIQSIIYEKESNCAYIIDSFIHGVWIWVGRLATLEEKIEAIRNVRGFVKKKKYPFSVPIIRIIEGHEPNEFVRLFPNWINANRNNILSSPPKIGNGQCNKIAKVLGKLESLALLQRPKMSAESQLIDAGTGEKYIYRIVNGKCIELPKEAKNIPFYSSGCYILHYIVTALETHYTTPGNNQKCNNIFYLWIGRSTTNEMREKCELLAQAYFQRLPLNSMMVKIYEGYETPHFLQIFNGKFITLKENENNDNFNNSSPSLTSLVTFPSVFILRICGDSTYNSKAIQIEKLNFPSSSKECLVIKVNKQVWVWCGQSSTGDAREMAKNIGSILGEYSLIMETMETDEFWESAGDLLRSKEENGFSSPINNNFNNNNNEESSFLSEIISRAGLYLTFLENLDQIEIKEIISFDQNDLSPEGIYLLDIGNIIYIWIGSLSAKKEQEICWSMAKYLLKKFPIKRCEYTAIVLIRQGYEPNTFTGLFQNWKEDFWMEYISYEKYRENLAKSTSSAYDNPHRKNDTEFDRYQKYPLSVLQQEADNLPSGINLTKKEIHLTHDDFVELFKMNYQEFDTLPNWKKQELKKEHKLF